MTVHCYRAGWARHQMRRNREEAGSAHRTCGELMIIMAALPPVIPADLIRMAVCWLPGRFWRSMLAKDGGFRKCYDSEFCLYARGSATGWALGLHKTYGCGRFTLGSYSTLCMMHRAKKLIYFDHISSGRPPKEEAMMAIVLNRSTPHTRQQVQNADFLPMEAPQLQRDYRLIKLSCFVVRL